MKLHDIRTCIKQGVPVHYLNNQYTVEPIGNELIVRNINTHDQFFLTDSTGIVLNGMEEWFYKEKIK
jgi:hypothetical protein